MRSRFLYPALIFAVLIPFSAQGEELDCIKCHGYLKKEPVLHQALEMGCVSCHEAENFQSLPHKKGKIARSLMAPQPELCYSCHDKAIFGKKTVHAALGMGCTSCHNPHATKNAKLLKSALPDLCYECHDKSLFTQKTVHAALGMGCTSCHNPHSSDAPKLLTAEQPNLCFGCHDKAPFTKKNIHAAVGMGCTGCHSPHSSQNSKLTVAPVPDLCFTCHDKGEFTRKVVHPPVMGGECLSCHVPHASDEIALLSNKPYDLCLGCHPDVPNNPHAVSGFTGGRHPLGGIVKKNKAGKLRDLKDPARKGRPFYCGSCHEPHSSEGGRLFRFKAMSSETLCVNCHKM